MILKSHSVLGVRTASDLNSSNAARVLSDAERTLRCALLSYFFFGVGRSKGFLYPFHSQSPPPAFGAGAPGSTVPGRGCRVFAGAVEAVGGTVPGRYFPCALVFAMGVTSPGGGASAVLLSQPANRKSRSGSPGSNAFIHQRVYRAAVPMRSSK